MFFLLLRTVRGTRGSSLTTLRSTVRLPPCANDLAHSTHLGDDRADEHIMESCDLLDAFACRDHDSRYISSHCATGTVSFLELHQNLWRSFTLCEDSSTCYDERCKTWASHAVCCGAREIRSGGAGASASTSRASVFQIAMARSATFFRSISGFLCFTFPGSGPACRTLICSIRVGQSANFLDGYEQRICQRGFKIDRQNQTIRVRLCNHTLRLRRSARRGFARFTFRWSHHKDRGCGSGRGCVCD